MQSNYNILYLLLFCLFLTSCQELYLPEDLDIEKQIPVIQGFLSNDPGPYEVSLTWASSYNEHGIHPIQGATVIISDDKGNTETLEETTTYGIYQTRSDGLRGTVGNTYTLQVILPDGTRYLSAPSLLNAVADNDSIYAEIGTRNLVSRSSFGELVITEQRGLKLLTDINSELDGPRYFRFQYKYVQQYENQVGIPIKYCLIIGEHDDMLNIKSAILADSEYNIRGHTIGFLPWLYDPSDMSPPNTTAPIQKGWVSCITTYSINADAYNYYQMLYEQLTAKDRIFDPIPTQINGNIKCITDTTQVVLGLFEVAAVKTYYAAFHWNGADVYKKKALSEYDWPVKDTCLISEFGPPAYWVRF